MSTLPSDTPRLPKWPFLITDALLLAAAAHLALRNPGPYTGGLVAAITICVVLGCILGAIPFLSDYAHRQDEAIDERQRGLEALTRTIADAAEQISVAANSMHETLELARRQSSQSEALPDLLNDQFAELNQQVTSALNAASETLQKEIKAAKATAEPRKPVDHTPEKLQLLHSRLEALETKLSAQITALALAAPPPPAATPPPAAPVSLAPVVAVPSPEPATSTPPPRASEPEPPATLTAAIEPTPEESVEAAPAPTPAEPEPVKIEAETPAKKPASAKKPKTDDAIELPFAESTPPPNFQPTKDQPAPTATADSSTRLLVTAYIGIGNRLFIRGAGPGLDADKGVPLQFVSIGKWLWETKDATGPVRARLFKNDQVECVALGEITFAAGQQLEVSATF